MGCTELDTTEATSQQQQRRREQEEKKHTEIMTENFSRLIKTSSDGKKNLPAMNEIRVRFLGQEDPLWKGMLFLLGESHVQRSLASYSPWCCKKSNRTKRLTLSFSLSLS